VDIADTVKQLNASIDDPSQGLPEEVFLFIAGITPMVNVDLLIRDDRGRVLLTWRDDGFCPAGWHVPGGIIRYRGPLATGIAAVAKIELGTTVTYRPEPLAVNEVIRPDWAIRGHFISFLYDCRLDGPPREDLRCDGRSPRSGDWAWHETCPANLIEVQEMYRRWMQ
jgi:ADP-ribose pyrophosphatase YjhB (NUDIX family)